MKGHVEGAGATEVGLATLEAEREGRNTLFYLYLHPPTVCQCLPLSKYIRKTADTGGWKTHAACRD